MMKRVLATLFMFSFLSGCSKPCAQWEFEKIASCFPCGEIKRISYPCTNAFCELVPEFVADCSSFRLYLNVYMLEFPWEPENDALAKILVTVDGNSQSFIADRLSGGQRLLVPAEAADLIVDSLLAFRNVRVESGRYAIDLTPENFQRAYRDLQSL